MLSDYIHLSKLDLLSLPISPKDSSHLFKLITDEARLAVVEYRALVVSADIKGAGISTEITFETTPASLSDTVLDTCSQVFRTETAALSIHLQLSSFFHHLALDTLCDCLRCFFAFGNRVPYTYMIEDNTVLSIAMNDVDPSGGRDNYIGNSIKISSPQLYGGSESEDANAVQLPSMDKRKPLENDAKDLMMISDPDQQQEQHQHQYQQHRLLLNSTSCSSCFSNNTLTQLNPIPSQQARDVKKSFEAPSSALSQGHRGNQGIRVARERFLRKKAAKLRGAKAVPEALIKEYQTSVTSRNSFGAPHNQLGVLSSSSKMSSTSLISAQQKAAPQPATLLPPRSSHARNLTSSTTVIDNVYNRSPSHGRLHNNSQHPRPRLPNDCTYLPSAMTGPNNGAQNHWSFAEYLFIKVSDLPENITTRDIWESFKHEGHIAHIRLHENVRGYRDGGASVKFRYASDYCACSSHGSN